MFSKNVNQNNRKTNSNQQKKKVSVSEIKREQGNVATVSSIGNGVQPVPDSEGEKTSKPVSKRIKIELRNTSWRSNVWLILFMFVIVVYGLVILYSVSAPVGYINSKFTTSAFFAMSQLKFTAVGIGLALLLNFIPIDIFKRKFFLIAAYGVSFALIVATTFIGEEKQQARRWLKLGSFEFQTSEVFKIGLVLAIASYRLLIVHLKETGRLKPKDPKKTVIFNAFFEIIIPGFAILVPAALVLIQPHFSCFLILAVVTVVCFLASGIDIRSWIVGGATVLATLILIGGLVMIVPGPREKMTHFVQSNFAHVFKRLSIYTQDEEEELTDQQKDEALQVTRAKDAIGSGGLTGVGFGESRSKYSYVSESHNDYIFSIYIEETGFVGGVLLIFMYLVLLFMGLKVACRAKDVFCRVIATGYTFLIVLEAMWNIGVELTVLPSTGITLPFFSYGGTAQVLLLIAFGMILCVARSGVTYETKEGNA